MRNKFFQDEQLYTDKRIIRKGKTIFKYADLILSSDTKYYHAVFVKEKNYFTILMDDYETLPTLDIARLMLHSLINTDWMLTEQQAPNKHKLEELYDKLNSEENYFKVGNYIIKLNTKDVLLKDAIFSLGVDIKFSHISIFITNMSTRIEASINSEHKIHLTSYDKLFSIYVNGEALFNKYLCINSVPENDRIKMLFVPEDEYHLKHSSLDKSTMSGDTLWALQTMNYSINIDRDEPFEIKYESQSIDVRKRRFFIVFAINGIKIKNDIRFGLITFSNDSGIASDREIKFNDLLSRKRDCYAQVVVVEESLRKAVDIAINMLEKAINILYMILLDDSARNFFGIKESYKTWNYENISINLSVNDHFYIEDVLNINSYAVLSSNKKIINEVVEINEPLITLLNSENILEDFFYLSEQKKKDDLLQSIFWLNSSKKSKSKKEKVISLYNSVEFLVTGEKGETLDQTLKAEYGDEYIDALSRIISTYEKIGNDELKKRIKGIITNSFKGTSSVRSKLECLIEKLNLSFTEAEWDLFDTLKNNRHKLIHNKFISSPITNHQLDELYHLFSKLIVYKINLLINGENND